MSETCQELQNIKYQTMLLNHNSKAYESQPNVDNIEFFLASEKEACKKKPWSKLSKASKLKKINEYSVLYCTEKKIEIDKCKDLKKYLEKCLNRKKIQRQKDVVYDIETNKIKSIHGLHYNKTTNKFTLSIKDKKTNTLKSLPPKKNKTQTKNGKKRRRKKSKIDTNIKE